MDSSNYSDAAKAKLRADVNNEVAIFLQRLQSLDTDDGIDDFGVENIREEASRLHTPTAPGRSSSDDRSGTTTDRIAQQTADNTDQVKKQIVRHLIDKELSKIKRDKTAQMVKLRESMIEMEAEMRNLLWNAELQRRSHTYGDTSTDFEMNKILDQWRAKGMEFHQLNYKYSRLANGLRNIQRRTPKRENSRQ